METKRFYRSRSDRKIAGVAAGLGEYFDIDPLLMRLIFVILALAGGGGVLIYIILWIITPDKPFEFNQPLNQSTMDNQQSTQQNPSSSSNNPTPGDPLNKDRRDRRHRGSVIGGLVLITLGVLFLADEFIPRISFSDLWPIILVVIGVGLLITSINKRN